MDLFFCKESERTKFQTRRSSNPAEYIKYKVIILGAKLFRSIQPSLCCCLSDDHMMQQWKSSHGGHIFSSAEIRFLLAHKCQGSLHFSARELCRRGTPAALQSIRSAAPPPLSTLSSSSSSSRLRRLARCLLLMWVFSSAIMKVFSDLVSVRPLQHVQLQTSQQV